MGSTTETPIDSAEGVTFIRRGGKIARSCSGWNQIFRRNPECFGYLDDAMRPIERALVAVAILWPVPFLFQALDWSDQGYWVSNYLFFTRDPASISSSFTCWLTVLIGGVWMRL